jgi:hypothetical protein
VASAQQLDTNGGAGLDIAASSMGCQGKYHFGNLNSSAEPIRLGPWSHMARRRGMVAVIGVCREGRIVGRPGANPARLGDLMVFRRRVYWRPDGLVAVGVGWTVDLGFNRLLAVGFGC